MSNFRVGVLGAKGKVRFTIYEAVGAADDSELTVGLDSGDDPNESTTTSVRTIVDFAQPDPVMGNLGFCTKNGINAVVGTAGFTKERLDQVQRWPDDADSDANVLIAPNFTISAVLTMKMAEFAAPYSDSAEVVEMYHPLEKDAPSGTTTRTTEAIAHARKEAGMGEQPDATEQALDDARGAETEGIPVHAAYMTGSVTHEIVISGVEGQSLTIKQGPYPHTNFVPGVLLGVCEVEDPSGLTVGLEPSPGL